MLCCVRSLPYAPTAPLPLRTLASMGLMIPAGTQRRVRRRRHHHHHLYSLQWVVVYVLNFVYGCLVIPTHLERSSPGLCRAGSPSFAGASVRSPWCASPSSRCPVPSARHRQTFGAGCHGNFLPGKRVMFYWGELNKLMGSLRKKGKLLKNINKE